MIKICILTNNIDQHREIQYIRDEYNVMCERNNIIQQNSRKHSHSLVFCNVEKINDVALENIRNTPCIIIALDNFIYPPNLIDYQQIVEPGQPRRQQTKEFIQRIFNQIQKVLWVKN